MLEVFATSRAVRSFYEQFKEEAILPPKAMSIGDLEQKAILVNNRVLVDDDMRVLLMQEATQFTKYELLHIDREFFTFLKNSSYLFRFFEELAHENVPLEALQGADTYALFDEHLSILQTLLKHYEALLDKHGLYDRITLPRLHTLNTPYICSLQGIRLHLEGFLSQFEFDFFTAVASHIPVHITLSLTPYNQKIGSKLNGYGFGLEEGYWYELNLSSRTVLSQKPLKTSLSDIECVGLSSRISQVGFVQSSIARFVNEGLKPEEIVVVLPDERFSESLRELDSWHNLNFAMGIPFSSSAFYQRLNAIDKALKYGAIEDMLRLKRFDVDEALMESLRNAWYQKTAFMDAMELVKRVVEHESAPKGLLLQEALFGFEHFLSRAPHLRFEQIFRLLLNRLSAKSLDDVRGGKVTVLGLLETRGVGYKGVIVIDFNDEFIPKRSQKDLFLSSSLRAHAGLPTKKDRENLQRYYYHQLLHRADKVAISYVSSELSMPSRFLDELGFQERHSMEERILSPLILQTTSLKERFDVETIDAPYDLRAYPLSATKLKTLLSCARQFYFRYVLKIKDAKMPSSVIDEQSIGIMLHEVLETVVNETTLQSEASLKKAIVEAIKAKNNDLLWGYFADVWAKKLDSFIANEVARYQDGYRIAYKESNHTLAYQGFRLEGKIDRIDVRDGKYYVIDYKSGKVPLTSEKALETTKEFQLVFYELFAQALGTVDGVYYYDLKEGELVEERFIEEKKERLNALLETFSVPLNGYEKCEESATCRLCPYVLLCGKEDL